MTSKAQRRRRAKRATIITLPNGERVAAPAVPGQHKPKEDPMATVTAARQRHSGIADPKDARQPLAGTDMGLCIDRLAAAVERADLADAWAGLSAAHRTYRQLIIGTTGDPQAAAIPMLPEPMQTDQSLRVDLRSEERRIADARRAWAEWQDLITALPVPSLRWAIRGALDGFLGDGTLWRDQAPTTAGKTAVQALRLIMVARRDSAGSARR